MSDVPEIAGWPVRTRPNPTRKLPYGYVASPEDPLVLHPDPEIIPKIEEALDAVDNRVSLREAAAWLSEETGVRISHQGLNYIWKRQRGEDPKNARAKENRKKLRAKKPKTGPEKAKARVKRKLSDARRVATMQERKLAGWKEPEKVSAEEAVEAPAEPVTEHIDREEPATVPAAPKAAEPEDDVIFRPNPGPQTEFLAASEQEVLYGGAAGGGKSYALLADPMRYFGHPQFNGLILRRTTDELRELIWKSQELYPKAFPGAKWGERKSQWQFPSGARLWLTYLERDEDVLRYQGQAFSYVGFDELTQYATPFAWNYLRSRLRTTASDLPIFMRGTTNPGGPGHGWVKRTFIDPAPPNTSFCARDLESGEELRYPEGHARAGEPLFRRRFIPASLYDNPYLTNDGTYEANLLSLPEMQRRQLLEGDWAVADGAAFPEFRQSVHVAKAFDIPDNWRRFRSCDFGYSSFSAVHWYAIDPAYETLFVYRELYVSKHTGRDLSKAIREIERGERIDYGILDSSCWHQRGQVGPSIAEEMINAGTRWRPSDRTAGARINGKNRLHEVLKVDAETGLPGIIFFDNCRQIIADLPVIPADPKGSEDIDPRYASDHAYDSIRYGVMSRPRAFSAFEGPNSKPIQNWRPADATLGY